MASAIICTYEGGRKKRMFPWSDNVGGICATAKLTCQLLV